MTKEDLTKDIKVLNNTKKLTGNIGLYRRVGALKQFCTKYKKYPGVNDILDELSNIDLLNGQGVEKISNLDEYQEKAIKKVSIILDFEESKKTLKACRNSCKKYYDETPETALVKGAASTSVYKNFKKQRALFQDRLVKCDKLQEKLDTNEISMEKFVAEVNNIKKAIVGTVRELKTYGLLGGTAKNIKNYKDKEAPKVEQKNTTPKPAPSAPKAENKQETKTKQTLVKNIVGFVEQDQFVYFFKNKMGAAKWTLKGNFIGKYKPNGIPENLLQEPVTDSKHDDKDRYCILIGGKENQTVSDNRKTLEYEVKHNEYDYVEIYNKAKKLLKKCSIRKIPAELLNRKVIKSVESKENSDVMKVIIEEFEIFNY